MNANILRTVFWLSTGPASQARQGQYVGVGGVSEEYLYDLRPYHGTPYRAVHSAARAMVLRCCVISLSLSFDVLSLFFAFAAGIQTGQANRSLDPLVALSANIQCLFEAINDASLQVRRIPVYGIITKQGMEKKVLKEEVKSPFFIWGGFCLADFISRNACR